MGLEKKSVRASVREVAEFSTRKGSIQKGRYRAGFDDALDGTKLHIKYQQKLMDELGAEKFKSEVYRKLEIENSEILLTLSGRIDGVADYGNSTVIYEIKTTSREIDTIEENEFPSHWAQAECYSGMYIKDNATESITIVLVYINRETEENIIFERTHDRTYIENTFENLLKPFMEWMSSIRKWEILRNKSIDSMEFPFSYYRLGQRDMAEKTYRCIKNNKRLFIQAPTGIGKTMGAMFPAIKSLGEGLTDRIFYLTAKTVTSQIAVENYKRLAENGLNLRAIVITAKDKVCPMDKRNCDPEFCQRAKDYYERLPRALGDLLANQFMDRNVIKEYADRHNVCPFELSLDASLSCDMLIGDYNYLFDPRVRLLRFFDDVGEKYCFLVDEAHNLVDRSREMFSAVIEKAKILELKRETPALWNDLKKQLETVNKQILILKKEFFGETETGSYAASRDIPANLVTSIRRCTGIMEFYLDQEMDEEYYEKFTELYFDMLFFSRISELYDEHYVTFYELKGSNLITKLMCLDPSKLLSGVMDKGRSTVLFSATLQPENYYMSILGGRTRDESISLPSPFPRENLSVLVEGRISTKYRQRHLSYESIARLLNDSFGRKTGNYIAFFTSYRYMRDVLSIYESMNPETEIIVQQPGMDESEREAFLERFETHGSGTLVAFAVMGGIFGEGIDLAGERLSGVVVVGTGLPTVCPERELLMNYYQEANGMGFDYSYTFPGLNRVLQAAGRVIRSEYDKGFVILVDSRFAGWKYRNLYPEWWSPEYIISGDDCIVDYLPSD